MAYTPELSYRGSATLRRLAWFRGKPMTRTLEALLVCAKCKDNSACEDCAFQPPAEINPVTETSK